MAPRFPGRGHPNVGARLAHLAKRRRTDGTRRTTARGDEHFWFTFLQTARSFLGADVNRVGGIGTPLAVITDNLEKELARHPPSGLDRYLPWLYGQVDVEYAEKYARFDSDKARGINHQFHASYDRSPEAWRELRHWVGLTNPDLTGVSLQEAITRAFDWSELLEEVGGGGPLAENLHDRLPTVILNLGKGWVWRSEGHKDVWMAIGRELGHCYKNDFHLKDYINGYMWVLVGPKGKPHVTVTELAEAQRWVGAPRSVPTGSTVNASPITGRPMSSSGRVTTDSRWVVSVRVGSRPNYPVDASSQARFVKSIRRFVGDR